MDKKKAKGIIVREVEYAQGIRAVDLVSRENMRGVVLSFRLNVIQLLEELIQEGRLIEVRYVLPLSAHRERSFLLPADSQVSVSKGG